MNESLTSITEAAVTNLAFLFTDLLTAISGCLLIVFIIFGIFIVKDVLDRAGGKKVDTVEDHYD
ncbi:MAG: hypothetical protein NTV87_00120 [Ignavibacteriae bacterium]|nr:hypothetical protein [Ignavibacteriota bacterium]